MTDDVDVLMTFALAGRIFPHDASYWAILAVHHGGTIAVAKVGVARHWIAS